MWVCAWEKPGHPPGRIETASESAAETRARGLIAQGIHRVVIYEIQVEEDQ